MNLLADRLNFNPSSGALERLVLALTRSRFARVRNWGAFAIQEQREPSAALREAGLTLVTDDDLRVRSNAFLLVFDHLDTWTADEVHTAMASLRDLLSKRLGAEVEEGVHERIGILERELASRSQ